MKSWQFGLISASTALIVVLGGVAVGTQVMPLLESGNEQESAAMFRGNLQRTGEYPGGGPTELNELLWQFQTDVQELSSQTKTEARNIIGGTDRVQPSLYSFLHLRNLQEDEARNSIGVINRVQQAFYFENGGFFYSTDTDEALIDSITDNLGVTFSYDLALEFYDLAKMVDERRTAIDNTLTASVFALGNSNRQNNKTRDYVGGVIYNDATQQFDRFICRQTTESIAFSSLVRYSSNYG